MAGGKDNVTVVFAQTRLVHWIISGAVSQLAIHDDAEQDCAE
jgi:hypothetical protein